MKLRRLAAASATAAALFGVTAAAFPAAAQAAPLPLPALTSKALTGKALTARYQANDQAIARDARAAKQAGNTQLASALRTLDTKQVLFYSPAGVAGVGSTVTPAADRAPAASAGTGKPAAGPDSDCLTLASPTCYTPLQFRTAYGIQPLINRGITGKGETVVLPEEAAVRGEPEVSDIRQDLATYDSLFGLPAPDFRVNTSLAPGAPPYQASVEYLEDVEAVHAIAPRAAIRVILIPVPAVSTSQILTGFAPALRLAPSLGSVVSLSYSAGESCFTPEQTGALHSALQFDQERHVTVAVSSGDFGAGGEPCADAPLSARVVNVPSSDPLVLSAGGTSLAASHTTGAYIGETAWNRPATGCAPGGVLSDDFNCASGGGFSDDFTRPGYQEHVPGIGARRGLPDVSADADFDTGLALSGVVGGKFLIAPGGGTSLAAPTWAAIVALADQYAGRHLGFINPAIYAIGRSSQYHRAFHDITTGNNTITIGKVKVKGFSASRGWDPVTGWGSPDAQVLIPLLARYVAR
jgi:subtilase family serine protease